MVENIILTSTKALARSQNISDLFNGARGRAFFSGMASLPFYDKNVIAAVGWGLKPNTTAVRLYAAEKCLPYYFAEDGFIGYESHPSQQDVPLSLVLDQEGAYYDSSRPSDLENLIVNHEIWFDEAMLTRAQSGMEAIKLHRISKYNSGRIDVSVELYERLSSSKANVLVVDQSFGDLSVGYSGATEHAFSRMLSAAFDEHPDKGIFVKVHPDVIHADKGSYLLEQAQRLGVEIISEDVQSYALLEHFSHVYTVSSLLGMEALISGCEVVCFGVPFYSGWGLTDDRLAPPTRRHVAGVTLDVLFAAAYIRYSRYIDPAMGVPCSFERVVSHFILKSRKPRKVARAFIVEGFSPWKRRFIKSYLSAICPESEIRFVRCHVDVAKLEPGEVLVRWGHGGDAPDANVWIVEDGFVRSVGLGSDLNKPSSLVIDTIGAHYDVLGRSELECLILESKFTDIELRYAQSLMAKIAYCNISKYHVGGVPMTNYRTIADGRKVILVGGQVEGDRSLEYGSTAMKTNFELVSAVRERNPDAFIVYKVHPDIVSGNRPGEENKDKLLALVDFEESAANVTDMMSMVDEVHVICSLLGFEALIRKVPVYCYGTPFYAGWGLTCDMGFSPPWRDKNVSLEHLVLCALVLYPTYYDWESQSLTDHEVVIARSFSANYEPLTKRKSVFKKISNIISGW
ncbi:capsular polysaccharide biosynthesis protein [Vibrio sp. PNB22_3_1]